MPLLVEVGEAHERIGFSVLISASGRIEFLDYPFDVEAEDALEALGGGRSRAYDFYNSFTQGGLPGLLTSDDSLIANDVFLALVNQGYEAFGDEESSYTLDEFRSDLITALEMAFEEEDRFKTEMLSKTIFVFERFHGGLEASVIEEPTDYVDPYFPVRSTVCVLRTLAIGGVSVKTWSRCGFRLITDPVTLRPYPRAEPSSGGMGLWKELGAEEGGEEVYAALKVFGLLEDDDIPDVPDWDIPEKEPNGRWYVVFVADFERGQHELRYARYATYEDAREAALMGVMVVEGVKYIVYGRSDVSLWIAYDPRFIGPDMDELDTRGFLLTTDPMIRDLAYVERLKPQH
jgi:hypothetical protein